MSEPQRFECDLECDTASDSADVGARTPSRSIGWRRRWNCSFDLTFVIAFGISANEFAHMLAENHVGAGLLGFSLATFAVCWAWINFSWFASAYDTDDWILSPDDHAADGRRHHHGARLSADVRVDRAR